MAVLAALLLAVPSWPAFAERNKPAEVARGHYERGVRLFEIGQYNEALQAFEEAYKVKPAHALLFNLAQCRHKLGEWEAALRLYKLYLEREQDPEKRSQVGPLIEETEQALKKRREAPPPDLQVRPEQAVGQPPNVLTATAASADPAPVYTKAWFWGTVAGVAVVTVLGVVLLSQDRDPSSAFCLDCSEGAIPVRSK